MRLLRLGVLGMSALVVYVAVIAIAAAVFFYSVKLVAMVGEFPLASFFCLQAAAVPCAYNLWLNRDELRKK